MHTFNPEEFIKIGNSEFWVIRDEEKNGCNQIMKVNIFLTILVMFLNWVVGN